MIAGAATAAAMAAQAAVITPESYRASGCIGAADCRIGAARIVAGPAPGARLGEQFFRDVVGLGVTLTDTGADRDRELQGPIMADAVPGETISIAYDAPHAIESIVIAHLYNPGVAGDPTEEAIIEGFRDGARIGSLIVHSESDGPGDFTISGNHTATVHRHSVSAGAFSIETPFAAAVDRLVFRATAVGSGDTSDYSVVSIIARPGD